MLNFESGILDKTRLVSNVLLIILLAGNMFFSVQYLSSLHEVAVVDDTKAVERIQVSRFLKYFIDTVLSTQGTISFDDRVKLESDIRQIHDAALTRQWEIFVGSKSNKEAQDNAAKLMSMLANKML